MAGRLQLSRACAFQYIDDETVVVQPQVRMMHVLNEVGTFLWKELEKGSTPAGLVKRVVAEFEVDEKIARKDVDHFLSDLVEKGLLEKA